MALTEQQSLYEQTRARIQRNLDEVTHLANNCLDPKAFFGPFVNKVVDSLSAQGAALWQPRAEGFERVAEENFTTCQFDSDPRQQKSIGKVLMEMARSHKQYIVAAGNPAAPEPQEENGVSNTTPFPYFYIPILQGNRLQMVLQIWLKDAGEPKTYHDISAFLANWAALASTFLKNYQGAVVALKNEELQILLKMQSSLLGEHHPKEIAAILANYTTDLLKADLTCVYHRHRGGWKLISASNQEAIDQRSIYVQSLVNLVNGLQPTEVASVITAGENDLAPEIQAALTASSFHQMLFRLLGKKGTDAGDYLVCSFRHSGEKFSPSSPGMMNRIGDSVGKALEASMHYHRIPLRPLVDRVSRINRYWQTHPRRKLALIGGIFALVFVILFLIPYPLRITAECTILPSEKSNAVAETGGKIIAIYAHEGEMVKKGQVLAKIEDDDLRIQLQVSKLELQRWQVEASRAQAAGNEAERKLAELNYDRENQEIRHYEYLISKTEIISPTNGVILTHNLQNREGEKLEPGAAFCEIGGRDKYDVVLDINQKDIGDLLRAVEKRRLPVTFILHSHSQNSVVAYIENASAISQIPQLRKSASVFLATAEFPKESADKADLKPGYTGIAKVRIGTSNIAYSLLRPFLNYWRVNWNI